MNITLKIGALDMHEKLSTYSVQQEVSYSKIIVTMDDEKHAARSKDRYVVTFSLFPMTEDEATTYCNALRASAIDITFSDPYTKSVVTKTMRVTSNLDAAFALLSVNRKRKYKGGEIQMREN
jgi:protein-tyrosine-phosphatase